MTARLLILFQLSTCYCIAQINEPLPYAPEIFPAGISGAVCGFSKDGNTIYFVREDTVADQLHIFKATNGPQGWKDEHLLPFSGKHNDLGGRFTDDGQTFYFTSDRPGGSSNPKDTWNIWITTLSGDAWTEPIPLSVVNNRGLECCPLPLPGGGVLFSGDRDKATSWWISQWDPKNKAERILVSLNQQNAWQWPSSLNKKADIMFLNSMRRPDTRGMDDIYVSFRNGSEWTVPSNAGPVVNSAGYEDGAILSPDEEVLIFCRHATATTPSQVLCVKWKPVLESLKDAR